MYQPYLPQTDLQKLYKDVIEGPPSSALPQNLAGKWLKLIARDIASVRKKFPTGASDDLIENLAGPAMYLAGPTMLVLKLLSDFEGRVISKKDLERYDVNECIENYWYALADEIIRREIGISLATVTLETFFLNSDKSVLKNSDPYIDTSATAFLNKRVALRR